ncbi:MAG: SDR family NAD(P)-dependent oxidoreductase [Anaerolineales bacterium]|nr:SDR family NAD(P)-dependent oxidoreductase [Anaerolineales bacterium]
MNSIVVTGVSTGIGKSVAELLIQKGFRVFGSVRKPADADRLSAELGKNFVPLLFDVTDEAAVRAAAEEVRKALNGETLFGLVNNAGVAVGGPALHLPIADFRRQLEINVVGQLIVSQAFAPLLRAQNAQGKAGRIVNITSVSGKEGSPFLGAYSASKFALEGLSESMRRELMRYGIDVIIVAPGPIATPIWDKAEELDIEFYRDTDFYEAGKKFQKYSVAKGRSGLPPEAVGKAVYAALTKPHPRARYAVNPRPLAHWIASLLPKRVVDQAIAKALGLLPK